MQRGRVPTLLNQCATGSKISSITSTPQSQHRQTQQPSSQSPPQTFRSLPGTDGPLDGGELTIGNQPFDPTRPPLKQQLLAKLGLGPNVNVDPLQAQGGLNEGTWTVTDRTQCFVLKLVRGQNNFGMPSEGDKVLKLHREHPSISSDASLAFPVKVFRCTGPGGQKRYELIVMHKVPGQCLGELIARMMSSRQTPQLMQIFQQLGSFLSEFHSRYGSKQHNDFNPSNVFYDAPSGKFSLIDMSDMGLKLPMGESDVEHFTTSLRILSSCYGQQFFLEGKRHFDMGYSRGSPRGL